MPQRLLASELARRLQAGESLFLLDVREREEFEYCHLPGARWIPLGSIAARMQELDPAAAVVCICHHGIRSAQAALALEHAGFTQVYNLSGGLEAWARTVDPGFPRY